MFLLPEERKEQKNYHYIKMEKEEIEFLKSLTDLDS